MGALNSSLSTQQRKEKIADFFSNFVQFLESLQKNAEINVNCLTKLEELHERANGHHISHEGISRYQEEIATYLCGAFKSSLHSQLLSYWNCWSQIVNSTNSKFVNIREKTNLYISDIQEIDSIEAMRNPPISLD